MPVQAVLFDIGGPLDTEVARERLIDQHIRAAATSAGRAVSAMAYEAAARSAVESFAPDTYKAIIWHLAGHDMALSMGIYNAFAARAAERRLYELREGMPDLLARLHLRGVRLGLAANQPGRTIAWLDASGIGHYFQHREVSGTHGYRKPDVRLFLRACDELGVRPEQCIMVGDRIDNDIVPAALLGMRTVLFRTGRHRTQQPRSWQERPDAEVYSTDELEAALSLLLAQLTGP